MPTTTTLKLTMCSDYLGNDNNENSVIYIDGIKGEIATQFTSRCVVTFDSPRILSNTMTCDEELQLSFLAESTFVPVCNDDDPTLYDGCQCSGLNQFGAATLSVENTPHPNVTKRWLRSSELLIEYSKKLGLVIVTLPLPTAEYEANV